VSTVTRMPPRSKFLVYGWLACRGQVERMSKCEFGKDESFRAVGVDESLALTPTNFRASHALHNRQRAAV
jgi:hypothetical protein